MNLESRVAVLEEQMQIVKSADPQLAREMDRAANRAAEPEAETPSVPAETKDE